jgi:hypothetical protein
LILKDRRQAWDMQPDGSYVQRSPDKPVDPESPAAMGTHWALMKVASGAAGWEAGAVREAEA